MPVRCPFFEIYTSLHDCHTGVTFRSHPPLFVCDAKARQVPAIEESLLLTDWSFCTASTHLQELKGSRSMVFCGLSICAGQPPSIQAAAIICMITAMSNNSTFDMAPQISHPKSSMLNLWVLYTCGGTSWRLIWPVGAQPVKVLFGSLSINGDILAVIKTGRIFKAAWMWFLVPVLFHTQNVVPVGHVVCTQSVVLLGMLFYTQSVIPVPCVVSYTNCGPCWPCCFIHKMWSQLHTLFCTQSCGLCCPRWFICSLCNCWLVKTARWWPLVNVFACPF